MTNFILLLIELKAAWSEKENSASKNTKCLQLSELGTGDFELGRTVRLY